MALYEGEDALLKGCQQLTVTSAVDVGARGARLCYLKSGYQPARILPPVLFHSATLFCCM